MATPTGDSVPAEPIQVLYIAGAGRSGTTLGLERVLAQVPDFFAVGKMQGIWRRGLVENQLCGCGTVFAEFPFWRKVGEVAFGGWDQLNGQEIRELQERVVRAGTVGKMLRTRRPKEYAAEFDQYADVMTKLYQAIGSVSGGAVIVDSTKSGAYGVALSRFPALRVRAIHLIRDPHGVAYSWTKKVQRPDVVDKTVYMRTFRPARICARWTKNNVMVEALHAARVPVVRVRYEDLVRHAKQLVHESLASLGLPRVAR